MATIAIVGGAGFIGGRLAVALRDAGHAVTVVDVAAPAGHEVSYRVADVCERDALGAALEGADVVYNLAAVHRDDVRPVTRYDEVNVGGAESVCAVCRELGVERLIFTSTVAVYGVATPDAGEESNVAPFNAYGRSKLLAEQVYRQWQAEAPSARSLVIVRPTVVFGEGNRGNVYELVRQITSGRFVMVGSGRNRKSMAYVGNLSAFLVYALGLGAGSHLFNYVDKPDYSMQELVDSVTDTVDRRSMIGIRIPYAVGYLGGVACDLAAAITGRTLPISGVRVKKFCSTTTFSADRVASTGFRAPMGLRDALLNTVRYEVASTSRLDTDRPIA